MLAQAGLNREELFITSVVKCRPPANRTPKREEWETCLRLYLMPQLNIVGPRVVGLLGLTAAKALLGVSRLEDVRGKVFEDDGLVFLPTFHPAAAGRNPQWRRMLETDLLRLARLGAGRSR
jgi:DNA polymerase